MRLPTKELVLSALTSLFTACGGGPEVPNIASVGSVSLSAPLSTLTVGQKSALVAVVRNVDGNTMTGRPLVWTSSDVQRATVSDIGVVTAVAAGSVSIMVDVEGKSASVPLTITALADCDAAAVLPIAVAQVVVLTAAQKSQLCVGGGSDDAEYSLVVTATQGAASIDVTSANTVAASLLDPPITIPAELPAPIMDANPFTQQSLGILSLSHVQRMEEERAYFARKFPDGLPRVRSIAVRSTAVRSTAARSTAARSTAAGSAAARLNELPVEGSIVSLNAQISNIQCNGVQMHDARVVKVLRNIILYADVETPANGFTDEELISMAMRFDTLGYEVDTLNFGLPPDFDNNGRIGVFFTPGVGVAGYAGVVMTRDVLSKATCAASNGGEMIYLATMNTFTGGQTRSQIMQYMTGVMVHEVQHIMELPLGQSQPSWLNEGLSHIAEELWFYRSTQLTPRSNLGPELRRTPHVDAFLVFESQLFNLYTYFQRTEMLSPFGADASDPVRGAAWSILRFGADRYVGNQAAMWRRAVTSGLSALGSTAGLLRDWTVSHIVDDVVPGAPVAYTFPSWNYRNFRDGAGKFPFQARQLIGGQPVTISLVAAGAGYFRFRVAGGTIGRVRVGLPGNPPTAEVSLVRTK